MPHNLVHPRRASELACLPIVRITYPRGIISTASIRLIILVNVLRSHRQQFWLTSSRACLQPQCHALEMQCAGCTYTCSSGGSSAPVLHLSMPSVSRYAVLAALVYNDRHAGSRRGNGQRKTRDVTSVAVRQPFRLKVPGPFNYWPGPSGRTRVIAPLKSPLHRSWRPFRSTLLPA